MQYAPCRQIGGTSPSSSLHSASENFFVVGWSLTNRHTQDWGKCQSLGRSTLERKVNLKSRDRFSRLGSWHSAVSYIITSPNEPLLSFTFLKPVVSPTEGQWCGCFSSANSNTCMVPPQLALGPWHLELNEVKALSSPTPTVWFTWHQGNQSYFN